MIVGILQARCSSTRLPAKVMLPILGVPMLLRQIERVQRSALIGHLLVATSDDPTDDRIETLCRENGIICYRGKLCDVLDRYYQAAQLLRPEHIVRLTGDCPLADSVLIDQVIRYHLNGGYDYTSNALEPTFPDGLDVEVIRYDCLETAWKEAVSPSHREHVTPFFYQHPERFSIGIFKNQTDLSALRLTVDEQLDFQLITTIYEALYPQNPAFTIQDVLDFLDQHPETKRLNGSIKRNEGFRAEEG
ncbi:glycosyltransferase family protein [Brevibacillus humidisoli]|uniref:glycosyltransferase family protein n=1 Tax=Brevibacillus humidisoli TaxID=2895522 RepID=UPI001E3A5388|nr:glycosyltransferase family protein [Brevibacillus humidisoli]UFJ42526.1 glycosyltransferase family protein [Brevibacillus humidisoli]